MSSESAGEGGGEGSVYVHDVNEREQERLRWLNQLLNQRCLAEMKLAAGERVVDFGSGLAELARRMAGVTGRPVVGIERDGRQIEAAMRLAKADGEGGLVDLRQGDVCDPPLRAEEWGAFDVAHARFVLEHVPDPSSVIAAMVRAVHRGGRIFLCDDDHDLMRFWPDCPGGETLWRAYTRTYSDVGNDPYVGRKLATLLALAGARPFRVQWIFFGGCAAEAHFEVLIDNLIGVIDSARERILANGSMSPSTYEDARSALAQWRRIPDAALWYAVPFAEGIKP